MIILFIAYILNQVFFIPFRKLILYLLDHSFIVLSQLLTPVFELN